MGLTKTTTTHKQTKPTKQKTQTATTTTPTTKRNRCGRRVKFCHHHELAWLLMAVWSCFLLACRICFATQTMPIAPPSPPQKYLLPSHSPLKANVSTERDSSLPVFCIVKVEAAIKWTRSWQNAVDLELPWGLINFILTFQCACQTQPRSCANRETVLDSRSWINCLVIVCYRDKTETAVSLPLSFFPTAVETLMCGVRKLLCTQRVPHHFNSYFSGGRRSFAECPKTCEASEHRYRYPTPAPLPWQTVRCFCGRKASWNSAHQKVNCVLLSAHALFVYLDLFGWLIITNEKHISLHMTIGTGFTQIVIHYRNTFLSRHPCYY